MFYKHRYFILDTNSQKVFDENSKELRLTGNAYHILVFLCENKNAKLVDIGTKLDWAKDYDENNIRQYRYKINSIVGHDVIEYKNSVYSMVGDIKKTEKLNNRNTDLLHDDAVDLNRKDNMPKSKNISFSVVPAVIASVLLIASFFQWPYGYYSLLKIIVTGVAIYYAFYLYEVLKQHGFWFWVLIGIAIIFNPIFPIYLKDKTVWNAIDILVAIFLIVLILKYRNNKLNAKVSLSESL